MNKNLNKLINDSIENLYSKLNKIDVKALNISAYNKNYLQKYIENYSFYMSSYKQLLIKSINKLKKPITESVFVDYGGGCGILSYLAFEVGFKKIIYTDIYDVSLNDAQIISTELNIKIDNFILGDIESFVNEINKHSLKPDLICSFDVLEHIYNLNHWFDHISKINVPFNLVFMTSANSKNPFITKKLTKIHLKAEFQNATRTSSWKNRDLDISFLTVRKKIIQDSFPTLEKSKLELLASKSRGLKMEDILKFVHHFIEFNEFNYKINHPTNTCDPYTGNWAENLIDLTILQKTITTKGMTVKFTNSLYGYSKNKILNVPKFILNLIIKVLGVKNLLFSPTYTLEVEKINKT